MNKRKIIQNLLPRMLDWTEDRFSQGDIETFKRFVNELPSDLVNPEIYNPEAGIGLQFSWHFVVANLAISNGKIYVEKLDNDHLCDTRDKWFSYKEKETIPAIIIDFLKEHHSLTSIGMEKYLKRRRESIAGKIRIRKEIEEETKNMNPMQKMAHCLARPLRHHLDYKSVFRSFINVE